MITFRNCFLTYNAVEMAFRTRTGNDEKKKVVFISRSVKLIINYKHKANKQNSFPQRKNNNPKDLLSKKPTSEPATKSKEAKMVPFCCITFSALTK